MDLPEEEGEKTCSADTEELVKKTVKEQLQVTTKMMSILSEPIVWENPDLCLQRIVMEQRQKIVRDQSLRDSAPGRRRRPFRQRQEKLNRNR